MKNSITKNDPDTKRPPNHRLKVLMKRKEISYKQLAKIAIREERTIGTWLAGTRPGDFETRRIVADALGVSPSWLWDSPDSENYASSSSNEIVGSWARRIESPDELWLDLIASTQKKIDFLFHEATFLFDSHTDFQSALIERVRIGCEAVLVTVDPHETAVRHRQEEGDGVHDCPTSDNIHIGNVWATLNYLDPLIEEGAWLFWHDTPSYVSIYRFDDDMIVINHLYGVPNKDAPMLHLHRQGPGGMFDQYVAHFDFILKTNALDNTFRNSKEVKPPDHIWRRAS